MSRLASGRPRGINARTEQDTPDNVAYTCRGSKLRMELLFDF